MTPAERAAAAALKDTDRRVYAALNDIVDLVGASGYHDVVQHVREVLAITLRQATRIEEQEKILRAVEWSGGEEGYPCCPCCKVPREWAPQHQKPHRAYCRLAEIIGAERRS